MLDPLEVNGARKGEDSFWNGIQTKWAFLCALLVSFILFSERTKSPTVYMEPLLEVSTKRAPPPQ